MWWMYMRIWYDFYVIKYRYDMFIYVFDVIFFISFMYNSFLLCFLFSSRFEYFEAWTEWETCDRSEEPRCESKLDLTMTQTRHSLWQSLWHAMILLWLWFYMILWSKKMILFACFRPHRPVRARFHGLFSVTGNHSNVKFFCIFSMFFRCMCTVSSCRRCKCIAPVTRNHFRYIRYTCPNLWCNPCSKCYGMDCFGTYFTHALCSSLRFGCDIEQDNDWLRWKNETPARPYGTMDRCFNIVIFHLRQEFMNSWTHILKHSGCGGGQSYRHRQAGFPTLPEAHT